MEGNQEKTDDYANYHGSVGDRHELEQNHF